MREIRETAAACAEPHGSRLDTSVSAAECRALLDYWRLVLMGNHSPKRRLPEPVAGYFFQGGDFGVEPEPLPLGFVRRTILGILDRVDLSDDQRTVINLYYGLHGLPLPFLSKLKPDIAGGRDESSLRAVRKAAIDKVAGYVPPRSLAPVPLRRPVNPLLEAWFRCRSLTTASKVELVARAYIRAVSQCDGPYAGPTLIALDRWYKDSGYADPGLRPSEQKVTVRPNKNALNRAAALMEIALFEEVRLMPQHGMAPLELRSFGLLPVPPSAEPSAMTLPETVTHPDLVTLLQDDLSPTTLMNAAAVLQAESLNGHDVSGRLALFLRCVRPRVGSFSGLDLERLAVSISYVAAIDGNPFLSLEWLGHLLAQVGITDRTFTVLVNTAEAASTGGYDKLAGRTDRLFHRLRNEWDIPPTQIAHVEHVEAEQQRLVASAFHAEHVAHWQRRAGDFGRAIDSFKHSVDLASRSAVMAHRVLTDSSAFPERDLAGKGGRHGGDLTWPWLLAAVLRITQPLAGLQRLMIENNLSTSELGAYVRRSVTLAETTMADFGGTLEDRRFQAWYHEITTETVRLAHA